MSNFSSNSSFSNGRAYSSGFRSHRNYSGSSNNNNFSNHGPRDFSSSSSRNNSRNRGSSSSEAFIYKGTNKNQWSTLMFKIKQKLMADNLSYLEDAAELRRRTLVPPPALFIRPPVGHAEGALEKEIRAREQKIIDENHKLEVSRHNEYKDKLASDYPKVTTAHYHFLSRQIITDLERQIENISPPTTDAGFHYRAMKKRLVDEWGPSSDTDALKTVKDIQNLTGDYRGWGVYLPVLDILNGVLQRTLQRDANDEPILDPVPNRPYLPGRPSIHADHARRSRRSSMGNPAPQTEKTHKLDDDTLKTIVLDALKKSRHDSYRLLGQRYRQRENRMRIWAQLRVDMETLIKEDDVGTSRDRDELRNFNRHHGPDRIADSRSLHYHGDHQQDEANSDKRQRTLTPTRHDIRATTTLPPTSQPVDRPCANCGGPHRAPLCDSLTCSTCQATFPTAALRQSHYTAVHQPDRTKKLRFNSNSSAEDYTRPGTPPTRGYLSSSRSARAHEIQEGDQSPYDSGYDSTYSTASRPGNPPSNTGSDIDDQAIQLISDIRSARTTVPDEPHVPTTAADPRPTRITFESIIANFPPAAHLHPITADNGAIMAQHPFAQRPAPYPRPINNDSNPPDNDGDSDGPPSLIPDSDDSGSDDDSDGTFAHKRDDNCRPSSGQPATTHGIATSPSNFRTLPCQTWCQIFAGNQHTHPWTRSQPRPRAHYRDRHEDDYIFDVRMATKDSESTKRDEPDNPTYWHQPLTPPSFANSKPPTLTAAQIGLWRHTGLHWYAHIHLAFTTEEITDLETRPPPALRRTQYMEGNPHSSAEPFSIQSRLHLFAQSGQDWGTYIDGLAPHLRIHYQSQPPPPQQTANSSSQYHRAYDRALAPRRINTPREHTSTFPEGYNPLSRINPPREHMSTALEGYNSSNLYGKRTSENKTQLERQTATDTTSLGGYAQTQPLPHNPYNPQQIYTLAAPNRQETPQGLGHIAPIGGTILQAPPNHKQRAWQLQAPQTSLNEPTGQLPRPAR